MEREQHLEFCRKCLHRKLDTQQGLICNLTGKIAAFEGNCESFSKDASVKAEPVISREEHPVSDLNAAMLEKLRFHQDFYYALVGGTITMIISAIAWAIFTVSTGYQVGYMSVGVGLLVGFSVRFFGSGIDKKFGYLGAALSLLGCLAGNLFSQIGFIAREESLGYFETLTYLNPGLIFTIMVQTFNPVDIIFYGIAVYEGYRFAFRKVTVEEIQALRSNNSEGIPRGHRLRMPLVIISVILISFFFYKISQGVNGIKTFNYDSGVKMTEGELIKSEKHGKWTSWYENGNLQSIGFYNMGNPDSSWQWFNESGKLIRTGNYTNGIEHGLWMTFYEDGMHSDSGYYVDGRMDGEWRSWYENGKLSQYGYYKRDRKNGNWKYYYDNGQLSTLGDFDMDDPTGIWRTFYPDGTAESEMEHLGNNVVKVLNTWNPDGSFTVKDGEGWYREFSEKGFPVGEGKVEGGLRTGKWVAYFENGETREEGTWKDGEYTIINSWESSGQQGVKDGDGLYTSYYPGSENIFETGNVRDGKREGTWTVFFVSAQKLGEQNYIHGKLTGIQNSYYESGQLYSSGEMKDGKREGTWKWYYESGNILSTAEFEHDKKTGLQQIWNETGEKTKEEYYEDGDLVKEKLLV